MNHAAPPSQTPLKSEPNPQPIPTDQPAPSDQVPVAPSIVEKPTDPAQEAPKKSWIGEVVNFIKQTGTLRDGVLTISGIAYISGYGVWSYNLLRNNLGLLPAQQYQYFVGGVTFLFMAALLVAMLYAAVFVVFVVANKIYKLMGWLFTTILTGVKNKLIQLLIKTPFVLACIFVLPKLFQIVGNFVFQSVTIPIVKDVLATVILYLCGCLITGSLLGYHAESEPRTKRSLKEVRFIELVVVGFFTTFWITVTIFVVNFLGFGYPGIPQEFGGAKPRIAYLDVKRADLSAETRAEILPPKLRELPADISKDPSAVARSVMVDVYYTSSDFYLVRPHGAKVETPVTQVKKETVQGVRWLGYSEPALPKGPAPAPVTKATDKK